MSNDMIDEPLNGYVVHELRKSRSGEATVWAWCRVTSEVPGYTGIDRFTRDDGVTDVEPPSTFALGPVVVKLWC